MTNDLTTARAAAKAALEAAGVRAFTVIPERLSPPAAWIAPGDPYVTFEGASYGGGRIVRLQLVGVVAAGSNDRQAEQLDDLILQICDAVEDSDDLYLGDVGQPGRIDLPNGSYLACGIEAVIEIHHLRS